MRPVRLLAAPVLAAAALLPVHSSHAVDRTPSVDCHSAWYRQSGTIAWAGYATTPNDAGTPTRLRIICKYTNETGQYASVNESNASVVATYGGGLFGAGTTKVCESAIAWYSDNSMWTRQETCTP